MDQPWVEKRKRGWWMEEKHTSTGTDDQSISETGEIDLSGQLRQESLIERLLDLQEKLMLTTEAALQDGRFRNLSRKEMQTIQAIGPYDEKSMGAVAQTLGVTLGTLTVAINRLVKKGYVERRRAKADQRMVLLRLSREGQIAYRLYRRFNRVMTERILGDLSANERVMFLKFIENAESLAQEQYHVYHSRTLAREIRADDWRGKKLAALPMPHANINGKGERGSDG